MKIQANSKVLFQGDSITDAKRLKDSETDLGNGYAMMVASWITALMPERNIQFINRGVSGNTVAEMQSRWQEDCLDLQPDWVSIMIGVNDCWRRYSRGTPTSVEEYARVYREILQEVEDQTGANIILMEPFVLPYPEDRIEWREDLDPKIHAVRELAREFKALYVPLDGIFSSLSTQQPPEFWAYDGVHPNPPGHAVIARAWLQAVGVQA